MNCTFILRCGCFLTGCVVLAFTMTNLAVADDGQGKGKGKSRKAETNQNNMVQLDLNKLPPGLARQIQEFLAREKRRAELKTEAPSKKALPPLPPGLARKPVDHPGRINWLKAHGYSPEAQGQRKRERD
jgi:hypothetical protein